MVTTPAISRGDDQVQLPGYDPAWSRFVQAPDADGAVRSWHVLDTDLVRAAGSTPPIGTMLCVHGNPTWSYLWRRFLAQVPPGWRALAVDHLGMGWSDQPIGTLEQPRRLVQRVEDLNRLTDALGLNGPVIVVGHDWGGPIGTGWAIDHSSQVAGLVLLNTALQQPEQHAPPLLLRLAASRPLLRAVCVQTPAFVAATAATAYPKLPDGIRAALGSPYRIASRRSFIGQFVADIPLQVTHPSRAPLAAIAKDTAVLHDVPTLLLYGPKDPVFSEAHFADLRARFPHADIHRYEGASHLLPEDRPATATDVWDWVQQRSRAATDSSHRQSPNPAPSTKPVWSALTERATDDPDSLAVVEIAGKRRVSFAQLEDDVRATAIGLLGTGVRPGQRVALLIPAGIELTVAVYACWRVGAVVVLADAGLGVRGMARALRAADPDHVIGIPRALAALTALRVPGRRILAGAGSSANLLGATDTLSGLVGLGRTHPGAVRGLPAIDPDADAATLFTSGATGPAKGVVYRFDQLRAQIDLIRQTYGLTGQDRIVAAFAPFALYGPALGIGAVVPDMDVTAPATLTAGALADAVRAADATVVFASPAALRQVCRTAGRLNRDQEQALGGVRLVMSAGAPVPRELLRDLHRLVPAAALHTPYGMTEVLPVCDIDLDQLEAAGQGHGVCVGAPLSGVTVRISPFTRAADAALGPASRRTDGSVGEPLADGPLTDAPGRTGEICVRAAHVKHRYDRLWATEHASSRDPGWHRTGDVGHLDTAGRLWVQGRRVHVIHTAGGPLTPVGAEQAVVRLSGVRDAALVGVGPLGTQQPVIVIESDSVPEPLDEPIDEPRAGRPATVGRTGRLRRIIRAARPIWWSRLSRVSAGPLAPVDLTEQVRAVVLEACGFSPAAVLVTTHLPVDIRHQSKVDRNAVARWAERVLAGERPGRLRS